MQIASEPKTVEEELNEFEVNVKRLRIEYEAYFRGSSRRPPSHLAGVVQKTVTRFSAEPPRNTAQKFRLNSLIARYQAFRQQWGRILREIDAGTYEPHKFLAKARSRTEGADPTPEPTKQPEKPAKAIDQLYTRLVAAREETGQSSGGMTKKALEKLVREQTKKIRSEHGDVRVAFRVEVSDGRARLKARVTNK